MPFSGAHRQSTAEVSHRANLRTVQLCSHVLYPFVWAVLIRPAVGPGRSSYEAWQEDSIVQNDVEQRLVNPDAAVVFNKAELAKAIHEEADA